MAETEAAPKDATRTYEVLKEDALDVSDPAKLVAYLKEKYGDGPIEIFVKHKRARGKTPLEALNMVAQLSPLNGEFVIVAESALVKKNVETETKPRVKIT